MTGPGLANHERPFSTTAGTLSTKDAHWVTGVCQRVLWGCGAVLLLAFATNLGAEDAVVVSRLDGHGQTRRTGLIQEYTGEALTLLLPDGNTEQIPADRIVAVETAKVPDHQNADLLQSEGRYAEALASYTRAVEEEPRKWVRRQILAKMVRSYQDLGQFERAGNMFLIIVRSDPKTQLFDAIPLPWKSRQPTMELSRQAVVWMGNRGEPASVLLGASWLLATDRDNALAALRDLANSPDPRVAGLAEAQRWRAQVVTASLDDIRGWQEQLLRMDESLRAGPHFVIGQALIRQREPAQAALALMRVPILFPQYRDLAAESLFAAAEQLELLGEAAEARAVYRDLIAQHKNHALVPLAQKRLDSR